MTNDPMSTSRITDFDQVLRHNNVLVIDCDDGLSSLRPELEEVPIAPGRTDEEQEGYNRVEAAPGH